MKNISFSATTLQFRARRKHVSRRLGWKKLQPDNQLMGCEKCQGLRKGEKIVRMGPITILEVSREPVNDIVKRPFRDIPIEIDNQYQGFVHVPEVALEGFPEWYLCPEQFVDVFCEMNNCEPETEVTRILFDYVGGRI